MRTCLHNRTLGGLHRTAAVGFPPLQGEGWGGDGVRYIYTYDPTGNRTAKIVNGEPFEYINERQSNRLLRVEGAANLVLDAFTYDEVGSTISHISTNATNGANNANDFIYDARGRLVQANGTSYKINSLGQRIEKQGMSADTPSGTRHFVYDGRGHLIGEYDPVSGNAMIEHIWLGSIPVATVKNGAVYYIYHDHLGTPRAITNTANQTVWHWNYDEPFGETAANENPNNLGAFNYNLRFPGQYFDNETGLHYNWYRTYNPNAGKYVESDPIGLRAGLNTYSYAMGSPLVFFDPKGLIIYLCNRDVRMSIPGNHAYFWDSRTGECCGRDKGNDPMGGCVENGPSFDACIPIPGSEGKEDEVMKCGQENANKGPWVPPFNDCHTSVRRCLKEAGLPAPSAPGGRLGECKSCWSKPGRNECDPCHPVR